MSHTPEPLNFSYVPEEWSESQKEKSLEVPRDVPFGVEELVQMVVFDKGEGDFTLTRPYLTSEIDPKTQRMVGDTAYGDTD